MSVSVIPGYGHASLDYAGRTIMPRVLELGIREDGKIVVWKPGEALAGDEDLARIGLGKAGLEQVVQSLERIASDNGVIAST